MTATQELGSATLRQRNTLTILLVPIIAATVCAQLAEVLMTSWADTHPLALISLSSRNTILVLTTNQLDAISYYVVGAARLLVTDPFWFLIGWLYGHDALLWFERRVARASRPLRWIERTFSRRGWPLVLVAPNPLICLLAGMSKMNVARFAALNVIGTLARLYLIRQLGSSLEAPIDSTLDLFARFRLPLFVISVVVVATLVGRRLRQRRNVLAPAIASPGGR